MTMSPVSKIYVRADENKCVRYYIAPEHWLLTLYNYSVGSAACLKNVPLLCSFLPYLGGTKGLDTYPDGMICEGIDSKPVKFDSFRASRQNSSVKAFLISQHSGTDAQYLNAMLDHMPQKHQEFLQYLSKQPSLCQYVMES